MKYLFCVILFFVNTCLAQDLFLDFSKPRVNKAGAAYPSQYTGDGQGTYSIDTSDGVGGNSLRMVVTSGHLYAQFNAHNANGTRGYAHEYSLTPWKFDTYNRMEFWMKAPKNSSPLEPNYNQHIYQVGTFIKTVKTPNPNSDETGNNHWYHLINVPPNGYWTKVVLNHHPHHLRSQNGSTDLGVQTYRTNETGINYFDALTRWYIDESEGNSPSYPKTFRLGPISFWKEPFAESDTLLYSLTASYGNGRLYFCASARKSANPVWHEVRWSKSDIRKMGWISATVGGRVIPGDRGYNGMVFQSDNIPLKVGDTVYVGIKPENSSYFAQIMLPIFDSLGRGGNRAPVVDTTKDSVVVISPIVVDTAKIVRDTVIKRDTVRVVDSVALVAARDSIAGLSRSLRDVSLQLNVADKEIFALRAVLIATRDSLAAKPDTVTVTKEVIRDSVWNYNLPNLQIQIKTND